MKNFSNTLDSSTFLQQMQHFFGGAMTGLGHGASRLGHGAAYVLAQIQIGRMQSVLHSLSDNQLEQIDLKRSDINRYAHDLIKGESTGL